MKEERCATNGHKRRDLHVKMPNGDWLCKECWDKHCEVVA